MVEKKNKWFDDVEVTINFILALRLEVVMNAVGDL